MIDFSELPVIDGHCHPWRNDAILAADPLGFEDRITMMGMCLITSGLADEETGREVRAFTETTPLALAMRRRLALRLGCEPARDWVAGARRAALSADPVAYSASLFRDIGVEGLVYDEGYPQPTISREDFAATSGVPVYRVARIEPFIVSLRDKVSSYRELEDAFVTELEHAARDPGLVAFKSVIAYRTGLDVSKPSYAECEDAFERWRSRAFRETRSDAKPIRDALLRRTIDIAGRHDRPLHIHCGGGDPAVVLAHARPQDLYPLLAERTRQPFVLIHSGWPWVEEAAYVASVLPNVYLDVSLMLPWTSLAIDQKLEVILGAAPPAKVLYGSDEASEPEVIWLAAQIGRESLGRVLETAVERHWIEERDARAIAAGVLAGNVRRLHGLDR